MSRRQPSANATDVGCLLFTTLVNFRTIRECTLENVSLRLYRISALEEGEIELLTDYPISV